MMETIDIVDAVLLSLVVAFISFMLGGLFALLMASRSSDARYEESKLKRCGNCGHYMLNNTAQ